MPGMTGFEALPRIREVAPGAKVAVLSGSDADHTDHAALSDAALYLMKDADIVGTVQRAAAHLAA